MATMGGTGRDKAARVSRGALSVTKAMEAMEAKEAKVARVTMEALEAIQETWARVYIVEVPKV